MTQRNAIILNCTWVTRENRRFLVSRSPQSKVKFATHGKFPYQALKEVYFHGLIYALSTFRFGTLRNENNENEPNN